MSGLLATRTARRRAFVYVALLGVSLVLMAFSQTPAALEAQRGIGFVLRPFQGGLDAVGREVTSLVDAVQEIDQLRLENQALRAENERLSIENRTIAELRRENAALAGILQVQAGFDYETVASLVIAREASEFRRLITIDKGTESGIAMGDVVIAEGGALVGRVAELGPNFARVLLVSDTSSTVIGQLTTSGATGEVVGQLDRVLTMGKVDASVRVQLGEEVVTAGLELSGGIRSPYPKGVLIGQVVDFTRDANDVVQTVYVEAAADLDRLQAVLVVTGYDGGLPSPDQQAIDCSSGDGGTLPDSEQPCFTSAPATP